MERKRKNKANLEAEVSATEKPKNPEADKVKKAFDDISLYQAKRENLLLGEFSADGKYALKDDTLLQDLVSMPKVLQERVDNVVYAYTKYNSHHLNFKIDLDISESYCSAEIFLIEIEQRPDEDIKHLTSLGNLVEMYSPSFKDNVYKAWNINLQETPLDKDDVVFKALKELDGEHNFSKELVEILSQLYVVRMLKLLDDCGTLGLKIQGDYRALVEELLRKDPSLAQDYTRLKQLLDKMIAKHNGYDFIMTRPGGLDILKNYAEPIGRVTGKVAPQILESGTPKEEKPAEKSAEKKEEPKKKKSKSKGSGDSAKPYVWSIKNYKPAVFTTPSQIETKLPTIETPTQAQNPTPQTVERRGENPSHNRPTPGKQTQGFMDDDELEEICSDLAGVFTSSQQSRDENSATKNEINENTEEVELQWEDSGMSKP